ncbi:MAG: hypothetical protein BWY37_00820 [Firmicutes bacterium ADurb.Bin262]|nr:MAG: hypothetical protein BWY37_00820 [Firmicutes bacterium ADurb.Bin262]
MHFGADVDDARLVEVAQRFLADVRDVAGDFFRTELGIAGGDFELFDVDRGEHVVFDDAFADQDRVFEVVAVPRHERDEDVAAEREFAAGRAGAVCDDIARRLFYRYGHGEPAVCLFAQPAGEIGDDGGQQRVARLSAGGSDGAGHVVEHMVRGVFVSFRIQVVCQPRLEGAEHLITVAHIEQSVDQFVGKKSRVRLRNRVIDRADFGKHRLVVRQRRKTFAVAVKRQHHHRRGFVADAARHARLVVLLAAGNHHVFVNHRRGRDFPENAGVGRHQHAYREVRLRGGRALRHTAHKIVERPERVVRGGRARFHSGGGSQSPRQNRQSGQKANQFFHSILHLIHIRPAGTFDLCHIRNRSKPGSIFGKRGLFAMKILRC